MSETFLDKVVARTRRRVESSKRELGLAGIRSRAERVRSVAEPHKFRTALENTDKTNIIAEIKRASPSKGVIKGDVDVTKLALSYESGGATAISVLTEPEFFGGSLADLTLVRQAVDIPILRKDFIVDEYQIFEAAAFGAEAVLLIVAAMTANELRGFLQLVETDLGIDALVEVHTREELDIAVAAGARIIGVNNRDLHSLKVSLDVSRELVKHKLQNVLFVAESGLSTRGEIDELRGLGFDAFLIGETLMRSDDPARELGGLIA